MANKKRTRSLIFIMITIVVVVIISAALYYHGHNRWIDPRIKPARELYTKYNTLAGNNDFPGVIDLLNEVEAIYSKYPHYRNSFELGVIENNRSAVYLTQIISKENDPRYSGPDSIRQQELDSLATLAERSILRSISIYEEWAKFFGSSGQKEIKDSIRDTFYRGLNTDHPEDREKYLDKRVDEILQARTEISRRLSVSYTNLGVLNRFRENYSLAAKHYQKALELWEDNLDAENNLNHLLGRPLKKRSFLRQLFPEKRQEQKPLID